MRCALIIVLAAAVARAQFGSQAVATGASPGPSPTNSIGCHLHDGVWECAAERTVMPTPTGTGASASVPSPTGQGECTFHIDHWDCEESEHSEGGECIIHSGHTHGDCSEEQLACGAVLLQDYDMPLHIGSIFIILVTTAIGVLAPVVVGWTRRGDKLTGTLDASSFGRDVGILGNCLFIARHFGTGIIFSTAFIHLLYHGFLLFNNTCLGELAYAPTGAAIALASALITFLFDFVGGRQGAARTAAAHAAGGGITPDSASDEEKQLRAQANHSAQAIDMGCTHAEAMFRHEQNWQVLLLEAGILFHSIMIGITLGAGSGPGWTTLLIVIVFHQFFEAAALGARISLLYWISKLRAVLMALAFVLITPIGVAIGIGIRRSFSQNGKSSILAIGILNSVSAGILMYTAFRLLSNDFTEGPLRRGKWSQIIAALISITVGLVAMSVLGKWA